MRWRRSSVLAPNPHHVPDGDVFFDDQQVRKGQTPGTMAREKMAPAARIANVPNRLRDVRTADYLRSDYIHPSQNVGSPSHPVQQVEWSDDRRLDPPRRNSVPEQARSAATDFFSNPFGETPNATELNASQAANGTRAKSTRPVPPHALRGNSVQAQPIRQRRNASPPAVMPRQVAPPASSLRQDVSMAQSADPFQNDAMPAPRRSHAAPIQATEAPPV